MPFRPMRRITRFVSEAGILLGTFYVTAGLISILDIRLGMSSAWLLTIVVVVLRRRTPLSITESDAHRWVLSETKRKRHPTRTRYMQLAKRTLVWAPGLFAAGVLFFFPEATHLAHPRSGYVRHYRIPIPWNVVVLSPLGPPAAYSYVKAYSPRSPNARFDVTPWNGTQPDSWMVFGTIPPEADTFEFNHNSREQTGDGVVRREFRLGEEVFTCWQSQRSHANPLPDGEPLWKIDCDTPVNIREKNLYAWFVGHGADIPGFYKIVEAITLIQ